MAKLREFGESLPMLLLKAREQALRRFRPLLRDHGMTEQQWRVLRALQDIGPLTAAQLSKECGILAPSMTRIVRRLTDGKMVSTRRSKADQREVEVSIAARGARVLQSLGPRVEEQYAFIRDQLNPSEYTALTRALKRLIAIEE